MPKVTKYEPFYAVGRDCGCLCVTPIKCTQDHTEHMALLVECIVRSPFFFMSPLIIQILDELSIGTNVQKPVFDDVLTTIMKGLPTAKAEGIFSSGPITALFPRRAYTLAQDCLIHEREKKSEPKIGRKKRRTLRPPQPSGVVFHKENMQTRVTWEIATQNVLSDLKGFGVPIVRFRTLYEVQEYCK